MIELPVVVAPCAELPITPARGLLAMFVLRLPKLTPEQAVVLATIKLPCC